MSKNLIFILIILLLIPSANAFCIPFIQDCSQDIIIIQRGSNEDVNYSWIDTMEFAFEQPAKNVDVEIIGAELIISSSSSIDSASPINISTGISKLQLTVLSGADTTGDININAVKHDRDTGTTTEPYSESLALSGIGDMAMTVEWIGNKTASDDINLTTTNFDGALKLTQWSFYQDLQEDFNIIRISVTIETGDTASAKSFDFNFFKVGGDGNVNALVEFNDLDFAPNGIARNRIYRLDRDCVSSDCFIDADIDGIHAAFDQINIETVEIVISYEFTRQLQVSGVAGNNVTRLIAGTNIILSPNTGLGDVTINSTGGGGGDYTDTNVFTLLEGLVPWTDANINFDLNDAFHDGSTIDMSPGEFLNIDVIRNGTEITQVFDIDIIDTSTKGISYNRLTATDTNATQTKFAYQVLQTGGGSGDLISFDTRISHTGSGDVDAFKADVSSRGSGAVTGFNLFGHLDFGDTADVRGLWIFTDKSDTTGTVTGIEILEGESVAVDFGIKLDGDSSGFTTGIGFVSNFATGIDFNTATITGSAIKMTPTQTFSDSTNTFTLADLNKNAETFCDGNVFFSGDGECVAIGGGSGDVTASTNLADNNVVRGDGGAKGVQTSGIAIDDSDNVSGMGTLSSRDITIFDPSPILVFKDSDSLGAASVGFIEWRDSGGGRAGFLGNNTSGDDGLLWKNEQGGNIGIQTTGAGKFEVFANIDAQDNNITTTGTITANFFSGSGASLTAIPASAITAGTFGTGSYVFDTNVDVSGTLNVDAITAKTADTALTITAFKESTDEIVRFNGDGSTTHVRISINAEAGDDTGISFMEDGISKWSLGNDATDSSFHIRTSTGIFATSDAMILDTGGNLLTQGAGVTDYKITETGNTVTNRFGVTTSDGFFGTETTHNTRIISNNTTAITIDTSQDVVIGSRLAVGGSTHSRTFTVGGDGLAQAEASGGGAWLAHRTSSPSADNQTIGLVHFTSITTGSTTATGGTIKASSDGAGWSAGSAPTKLEFQTTPSGSVSRVTRLTIDKDGVATFTKDVISGDNEANFSFDQTSASVGGVIVAPNKNVGTVSIIGNTQARVLLEDDGGTANQKIMEINMDGATSSWSRRTNSGTITTMLSFDHSDSGATFAQDVTLSAGILTVIKSGGQPVLFRQDATSGGSEVLLLDQDDISEGFTNYVGSDRGAVTTGASGPAQVDSVGSFRVEVNGVVVVVPYFANQ